MTTSSRQDALVRAMPAVFVLIWATGFIVARYGMPHSPPMKFLARCAMRCRCAFLVWAMLAAPPGRATAAGGTWPSPAS
jgi:hypothetical protein